MTLILKYAEITRDAGAFPETTINALLARGFAHVLGNEVSSKVVARIRKEVKGEGKDVPTGAQVKAFREANAELVESWTVEAENAALAAMDEGPLGVRAPAAERAPRVDPLTREARKIAEQYGAKPWNF